jgi:uncharacterized membrane protein YkvI
MRFLWLMVLVLATVPLAGCEAIEGIFKAGMWVGALMVVLIVGIVAYIALRIRG